MTATYIFRRKNIDNGTITYLYKNGFKVNIKPDYPRFLRDVVKYARVKIEDIETEQDIKNLFTKIKNAGYDFHETDYSVKAVKEEWERNGHVLRRKNETYKHYTEKEIKTLLESKRGRKIYRKTIIRKYGKSKPIKYEEIRILTRWLE